MQHIEPKHKITAFNCPNCGAFAEQEWLTINAYNKERSTAQRIVGSRIISNIELAECSHCKKHTIWRESNMIFPFAGTAPLANIDLPSDIKADYNEARDILQLSPRGATALLRLAVQKLCIHLGEKGKNINDDIGNLVQKGLPVKMQKALDSVRVVGNNAVHPGVIDLKDNIDIASKLFTFINIIAEVLITQPKLIDQFYDENIPENQKNAITERDNN